MLVEIATATVASGGRPISVERLAAIEDKIRDTLRHTRAANTLRAYASDWADFVTWCAGLGLRPLPATAGTVAGYLSELKAPPDDRRPATVATLTRRLAALSQIHQACGYPNPCAAQLVKDFMRGARRFLGTSKVKHLPRPCKLFPGLLSVSTHIRKLSRSCESFFASERTLVVEVDRLPEPVSVA